MPTNVTETNKWTTECAPREVSVGRTPPAADERHADVWFAINDAFKHARRRLQDHVRRLQGQVKQHESQPIATVKTIDQSGEFGFLEAADGHEMEPSFIETAGKLVPETSPPAPSGGILFFGRSASETDRDGKRAFSIRAASPSFALLFPILLISRLA